MPSELSRVLEIKFGAVLHAPKHESLRCKLRDLGRHTLHWPLYVDTVGGLYAQRPTYVPAFHARGWYLLFDFHRLILYDDPGNERTARIDSIAKFIVDDYPAKPPAAVLQRQQKDFEFPHDLGSLEILSHLWTRDCPAMVTTCDLLTGEIRVAAAHFHPECYWPAIYTAQTYTSVDFGHADPVNFKSHPTTGGWRGVSFPRLDSWISPDVGVIREERLVVGDPVPSAVSRVAWKFGSGDIVCGGRSSSFTDALYTGRCEAIERQHVMFHGSEPLVFGSYCELQEVAVDPELLFYRLMRHRPDGRFAKYERSSSMYWSWMTNPIEKSHWLVPAQEIWFNTDRLPDERLFIENTTNGCALGSSPEEAAFFALLESIERDAYLASWYLRRSPAKVDPQSITYEPFHLLWARLRVLFPDYAISLFDIGTDVRVPVIAAVALKEKGEGARTIHAAAARPTVGHAAYAALKDLSARCGKKRDQTSWQLLANPKNIRTPEDHMAAYEMDEAFAKLEFFDDPTAPTLCASEIDHQSVFGMAGNTDVSDLLRLLCEHLQELKIPILFKDITQHEPANANEFCCVKALPVSLFPMWYGFYHLRVGVTDRLRRLAAFFSRPVPEQESDLNLDCHPFG